MGRIKTRDMILQLYLQLHALLTGSVSLNNAMGPVGLVSTGAEFARQGWSYLLWYLAMISANLAVVNFLPIPILPVDGGCIRHADFGENSRQATIARSSKCCAGRRLAAYFDAVRAGDVSGYRATCGVLSRFEKLAQSSQRTQRHREIQLNCISLCLCLCVSVSLCLCVLCELCAMTFRSFRGSLSVAGSTIWIWSDQN